MISQAASRNLTHPTARVLSPYDPWLDLRENWPRVRVVIETMTDDLLGEVRDEGALIALRAGTSGAQRRCTLAHELVHLERGILDCGPWWPREEVQVHLAATLRLISLGALVAGIRALGGAEDRAALAQWLDVDRETLDLRMSRLERAERRVLHRALARQSPLWSLA